MFAFQYRSISLVYINVFALGKANMHYIMLSVLNYIFTNIFSKIIPVFNILNITFDHFKCDRPSSEAKTGVTFYQVPKPNQTLIISVEDQETSF